MRLTALKKNENNENSDNGNRNIVIVYYLIKTN